MNPKIPLAAGLLAAALVAAPAHAALEIANGNFETGGGNHIDNVTGWFDHNSGSFWHGAWQTNNAGVTPNGTNVVVLSSNDNSPNTSATQSADVNVGTYLYQSIGTAEGAATLKIRFDWGAPNDDPGGRNLGLTVGVYAYDGEGAFTAADNADVRDAAGVTFLDSRSFSMTSTGADGQIVAETATLDISAAGSRQLFLRFNNHRPANTQSWPVLDNVEIPGEVPVFITQPVVAPNPGLVGQSVTITAQASADPEPAYQWEFDDEVNGYVELEGETDASLVIPVADASHIGFYRVIATNGNGSTTSNEVFLDIVYPDPAITSQPASVVTLPGGGASLAVAATGLGNLSYQWFKEEAGGDIELTGETADTLEIAGVDAADEGAYHVMVYDDAAVADEGFPTETKSATATVTLVDALVTASATAPATDAADQYYLPGNVDDVDNIDGSPGGVPIATSDANDASTYVAFDRTSQGMTFTTGSDPAGYAIASVTVRHVLWSNYLGNGTYYNIQSGDTFEFEFGSISGGVKTPVFDTDLAGYSGPAWVNPPGPDNIGSGTYFTFDLSAAGIGTLAPNTTYYFEIASGTGDPFFELSGTSADGYAGGNAFRGSTVGAIDGGYVALEGDRAFHVDLAGLSGPGSDFSSWIGGYPGVGSLTGFTDDADGDGLRNGVENYLGTDPSSANLGLVEISRDGNTVTFQHPNANPSVDVSGDYVWSTDLAAYHASGATSAGTTVTFSAVPDTPSAGTTTVTATISGTVPAKLFAALKATLAE